MWSHAAKVGVVILIPGMADPVSVVWGTANALLPFLFPVRMELSPCGADWTSSSQIESPTDQEDYYSGTNWAHTFRCEEDNINLMGVHLHCYIVRQGMPYFQQG